MNEYVNTYFKKPIKSQILESIQSQSFLNLVLDNLQSMVDIVNPKNNIHILSPIRKSSVGDTHRKTVPCVGHMFFVRS